MLCLMLQLESPTSLLQSPGGLDFAQPVLRYHYAHLHDSHSCTVARLHNTLLLHYRIHLHHLAARGTTESKP